VHMESGRDTLSPMERFSLILGCCVIDDFFALDANRSHLFPLFC
jgi:hypothetical protein